MARLLILGGTAEAAELAARTAAGLPDLEVVTTLAGRTRRPRLPPGRVRVGGFGGAEGLAAFIEAEGIDLLVDATHPFAATMAANAALACARTARPHLRLLRPMWPRHADDRWHEVADATEAARLVPRLGRRVLLTVGHRDLAAFAGLGGVALVVRSIEPPAALPAPDAIWLGARGPFSLAGELALFGARGIDLLVTKASGGAATYAKLAAARELALPVLMLRRPRPPEGALVPTVAAALDWLDPQLPDESGGS